MGSNSTIDLTSDQHRLLVELIKRHLPYTDVWAYGSRVTWTSRPQSDLDLVVFSGSEQTGQVSHLREAFEESDLPFQVDVLVWNDLPEPFQEEIDANHCAVVEIRTVSDRADRATKMRFGDCAALIRDHVNPSDLPGDTPYIGLGHIPKNQLVVAGHGVASDVTSTKNRFKRGDILFGKLNPNFRKVAWAQYDGICSTDIWVIRAQDGIDQRFLFYQMATQRFIDYAFLGSEGTSMPRAKWDHVSDYSLGVPNFAEQQRIARILSDIDDKILLNRRMAVTLEQVVGAVYNEWFGLVGTCHRLPDGWKATTIDRRYRVTMGQSPPSDTYNTQGEGHPFLQGSAEFDFRFPRIRKYCTSPLRVVPKSHTLLSVRAPVGDVNMALTESCIGRGVAGVVHESGATSYTYYSFRALQTTLRRYDEEGTVFGAITKKQLANLPVIEPPRQTIEMFESLARPIDDLVGSNTSESRILERVRDQLLSRLLV